MSTPTPVKSPLDLLSPEQRDLLKSLIQQGRLSPDQLAEVEHLLTGQEMGPVKPWKPLPGPQTQAFWSKADELFFGGSSGSGKSEFVLGLAYIAHKNSIIFRRVFPSLTRLIDRSRQIYGQTDPDGYNSSAHRWTLGDGRRVEFGHMQYEWSKEAYRGRDYDGQFWDEITEFTESMFRFVKPWNRSADPNQRCRIVCTGNPPTTPEGEWVIRYWAPWLDKHHHKPAAPGELRWFARLDDKDVEVPSGDWLTHKGERVKPRSRTFIPARLSDNPYLDTPEYRAQLQALPEPMRSQLLYGDFTLSVADDAWQVIPTGWVRQAQARWKETPPLGSPLDQLGVDVARGGSAKTAIAKRRRNWFTKLVKIPGKQTPDGPSVAAAVMREIQSDGPCDDPVVNVDVIGVGGSAYDSLRGNHVRVMPVNNGERSALTDRSGKFRLTNVRAASYWRFREALDPEHGDNLALPPDPELLADLCSVRYSIRSGAIVLEPKDDVMSRIGRSPDCGDAVVLAHWDYSPQPQGELLVWPPLTDRAREEIEEHHAILEEEVHPDVLDIGGVEVDFREKEWWE